jgi:hypothetical protein
MVDLAGCRQFGTTIALCSMRMPVAGQETVLSSTGKACYKLQVTRSQRQGGCQPMIQNPDTVGHDCEDAELYDLYLEFIRRTHAEIERRTVPGSFRDGLLADYRPCPREHFEARLESLRARPAEYAAAVAGLRRGFVPF